MTSDGPTVAVIPARFASERFPGKILADRTGRPLIQHVYERAAAATSIERVLVATDDQRIADAVAAFGGDAVMTSPDHPNGTSRIAEAAANLEAEIIVNVQGDEPEIDPGAIDRAVGALSDAPACPMSTLASPLDEPGLLDDPNVVKVILDVRGRAIYFSRAPIPHDRDGSRLVRPLRHIGLYAYRKPFLTTYVELSETPLERTEKLEQLRAIEHGYPIAVAVVEAACEGIDTPEQYDAFVARFAGSR